VQVYQATEWGLEAVPVIASLGKWAARSPHHNPNQPMSHVSLMMSLQTLLSPALANGLTARIGFRLGEANYVTTLHHGQLDVQRGEVVDCDVAFVGTSGEVAAVIHGGAPFDVIRVE